MVRRECGGLENMDTQANNGGAQRRLHPEERAKAEAEAAGPRMKSESLLDKIKRINAKGKDATADDLAEVFGAILKEGTTERVNRKTKELTPERNARIDKMLRPCASPSASRCSITVRIAAPRPCSPRRCAS
jgi:hypothetical protein